MNAKRDENHVPTIIGASNADGKTIIPIQIEPGNHLLNVDDDITGVNYGTKNAQRDENHVSCLMAVSSVDGKTPVTIYVNPNGDLLINSS